jgi:COP9 signalosome complex subunit 5
MSSSSSATALKTFSLANDVLEVSPEDQIYRYDAEADDRINQESPWTKECVRVRVLAIVSLTSAQPTLL